MPNKKISELPLGQLHAMDKLVIAKPNVLTTQVAVSDLQAFFITGGFNENIPYVYEMRTLADRERIAPDFEYQTNKDGIGTITGVKEFTHDVWFTGVYINGQYFTGVDFSSVSHLYISDYLKVSGPTYLGEPNDVHPLGSDVQLFRDLTVSGDLYVSGDFYLGDTQVDKMVARGDVVVKDDLQVLDDTSFGGDLTVSGDASISGDAHIAGGLSVEEDFRVHSDMDVFGELRARELTISGYPVGDQTKDYYTIGIDDLDDGEGGIPPIGTPFIKDFLTFRKTDFNTVEPYPDGGIRFVNRDNNGDDRVALVINGDGRITVGDYPKHFSTQLHNGVSDLTNASLAVHGDSIIFGQVTGTESFNVAQGGDFFIQGKGSETSYFNEFPIDSSEDRFGLQRQILVSGHNLEGDIEATGSYLEGERIKLDARLVESGQYLVDDIDSTGSYLEGERIKLGEALLESLDSSGQLLLDKHNDNASEISDITSHAVFTTGDQTIDGAKKFEERPSTIVGGSYENLATVSEVVSAGGGGVNSINGLGGLINIYGEDSISVRSEALGGSSNIYISGAAGFGGGGSSSTVINQSVHVFSGSGFWSSTGDKSDVFREDGNVGIGTSSPAEKLHIKTGNLLIERGDIILDTEPFIDQRMDNLGFGNYNSLIPNGVGVAQSFVPSEDSDLDKIEVYKYSHSTDGDIKVKYHLYENKNTTISLGETTFNDGPIYQGDGVLEAGAGYRDIKKGSRFGD